MTLKLQKTLSLLYIGLNCVIFIFALGFMTDFYILYMDGNQEMFSFFKDLQALNNTLFLSTVILFVLGLFQIPFEIHKTCTSIWGVFYALFLELASLLCFFKVLQVNRFFRNTYLSIDYSSLEGYIPNPGPFDFIKISYALILGVCSLLFLFTNLTFLQNRNMRRAGNDA